MKKTILIITIITLFAASCKNSDSNSPDNSKTPDSVQPTTPPQDTVQTNPEPPAPAKTTSKKNIKSGNEILAHIDNYLISTSKFDPISAGKEGISNASVSVQNKLPDAAIQKAYIEVSILLEDGTEYRTDYYTLDNIEPGDTKTAKIPNASRGTKIVSHIVKLKSDKLTNGEMKLVGIHYQDN